MEDSTKEKLKLVVVGILLVVAIVITVQRNNKDAKSFENIVQSLNHLSQRLDQLESDILTERDSREGADFNLWRKKFVSNDTVAFNLLNLECEQRKNFGEPNLDDEDEDKLRIKGTLFYDDVIQFDFMYPPPFSGKTFIRISKLQDLDVYECTCSVDGQVIDQCINLTSTLNKTLPRRVGK